MTRIDFCQALNTNNISEEGDPVLSCCFKTELASVLLQLTSANINLLIGPVSVFLFFFRQISELAPW